MISGEGVVVKKKLAAQYDLRKMANDDDRLRPEEKKILLYLLNNKKISRKEAVLLLDCKETKVKELFNKLISKSLVERKGKGRSTHYCLKENGNNNE